MRKRIPIASLAIIGMLVASVTQAQVNISSGGASFTWDPANPQAATFVDPVVGNVMFEEHWLIRSQDGSGIGVQTRVFSLNGGFNPNGVRFIGTVNSGDTAVSTWEVWGADFLHRVTITHTISLSSCGGAQLDYQVDLTNTALNAINGRPGSPVSLFNFFDYDIDPFATNSATAGFDGSDVLVEMSGDAGNAFRRGFGAARHELRDAAVGNRITTDILATTTYNLDNDPAALNNVDVTAAMQWDFAMPNLGDTFSFSGSTEVECQGPQPVSPFDFSVITGSVDSGGVPELLASDNQYLVLDPAFTMFRYELVFTVDATSPTDNPSALDFSYESKAFNVVGTVDQKIELFNYSTGQYETVDNRNTTLSDSVVAVTPGGDPTRFVQSGTGAMRARISYQNSFSFWIFVFSTFFLPYETSVDHIFWQITP